jgi:hypothetical protein
MRQKLRPLEGLKVEHKTGSCGKLAHQISYSLDKKLRPMVPEAGAKFQPNRIQGKFSGSF